MTDPSLSQSSELQDNIARRIEKYFGMSHQMSDNNVLMYDLMQLIATATRQAVKEELETLKNICMMDNVSVSGINRVIGTHIARLTQSNSTEEK